MKTFQTTRRVAHSAQDMFALVADVESYPQFLPLCKTLKLTSREIIAGNEVLTADMTVAYKLFRERFTSRVTLDPDTHQIQVDYLDGPFTHLENRWNFHDDGEGGCNVDFYIAYEFGAQPLQIAMGAIFNQAFGKFAESFVARADTVYGKPGENARTPLGSS